MREDREASATPSEPSEPSVTRRAFVGTAVIGAVAMSDTRWPTGNQTQVPAFALDEATIDDLQGRMRDGRDTARSLAQQYLGRIEATDQRGPAINAVTE